MKRINTRGEWTEDAIVLSCESDDFPNMAFQLCVRTDDPEDGLIIEMVGASVIFSGDEILFRGFVSRQDLEYEAAYRRGDDAACMAARDHESWAREYFREEWIVPLASWVPSPG